MTIRDIYQQLNIPPNLQNHLLTVARVAAFICDHWRGKKVNKRKVVTAALLHDVGNIVRFDLKKYPFLLGEEKENIQYWKKVQEEKISQYGHSDLKATIAMLKECHVKEEIIDLIDKMRITEIDSIIKQENSPLMILLYSDLRVSPAGFVSVEERLKDIYLRMGQYFKRVDLYHLGADLTKAIIKRLDVTEAEITLAEISDTKLLQMSI